MSQIIDTEKKAQLIKGLIDWDLLDYHLAHHFDHVAAPPCRLVIGLLYIKNINNTSYDETLEQWDSSQLLQGFCGVAKADLKYPVRPATLSIWDRELGHRGIHWMSKAISTPR